MALPVLLTIVYLVLLFKLLKKQSHSIEDENTGCDLVKFRGVLKLLNICMGYISADVFGFLKDHTYARPNCISNLNFKYTFALKFKLSSGPFHVRFLSQNHRAKD